jgi:putative two-component system response regulator
MIEMPTGLEKIVPAYLDARRDELPRMIELLARSDFEKLATLAHNIKGTGVSYGFQELARIGTAVEDSARRLDAIATGAQLTELRSYLGQVELRAAASDGGCSRDFGATPSGPAVRASVMLVDDDQASLSLMREILPSPRYAVYPFQEGRAALAAARESPPDLVLLDINMPEMTGYEICDRFKSSPKLSKIPVIFLTALNRLEDKLRGFRSGAVDYILKPLQISDVRARVDAHLRLSHLRQKSETDNCSLRNQLQLQVERISDLRAETIFAIVKVVEARDDQTGRHVERVQALCRLIAVGLSKVANYRTAIDSSWIEIFCGASPLHDVGKVAIPDRILLKPGPLNPAEIAIVKTHTTLGAQILKSLHERCPDNEFIKSGIKIARSHHERWDGSGYPDNLAGEEIPLCARILALADSYDAIRSARCYKPSIPHAEAVSIITRDSAKQFDPAITAVFSKLAGTVGTVWRQLNTAPDPRDSAGR